MAIVPDRDLYPLLPPPRPPSAHVLSSSGNQRLPGREPHPAMGKDVNEVMTKGAEHAREDHGIQTIPPDVAQKVQSAIKDR